MEILITALITAFVVDQVWKYQMRKFINETRLGYQKCLTAIEDVYQKEIASMKSEQAKQARSL